ncbi:hypothetical protein, partial [Serratia quinivorans]|uniref:hypothetical protein n=1 Tax=Serratia quinivorans TaxID=137545 RepID=UPI0021B7BE28
MLPSSSSLSQRLGLHELKAVLKEQTSPAQAAPEKAGQDTLRQLHDRMAQGEGWQEDEAFCQTLDGLLRQDEFRKAFEKDTGQALPEGAKHLDKTQSAKLISFISARVVPAVTTPASPEASVEQDFTVSARQSLQNVMKDCLQQMALDILLETGLKLTGMDKSMTETFVPVIKLIQE